MPKLILAGLAILFSPYKTLIMEALYWPTRVRVEIAYTAKTRWMQIYILALKIE